MGYSWADRGKKKNILRVLLVFKFNFIGYRPVKKNFSFTDSVI